jgi:hypothetical protein
MSASVDFSTLETEVLALWASDRQSAEALGHALIKLREVFNRRPGNAGGFAEWLRTHKMDRNRANYCIRVANGMQAAKEALADKGKKPEKWPVHPTAKLADAIKNDISQTLKASYEIHKGNRTAFARAVIGNTIAALYANFFDAQIFVDHNGNAEVEAAYAAVNAALEKLVDVAAVKAEQQKAAAR